MRSLILGAALVLTVAVAACGSDPMVTRIADVPYLTMGGFELGMDVYAPEGRGPWPVVVAFHGVSSANENAETLTAVAEAAADQGLLVFAPAWIAGEPFPITIDDIDMLTTAANCAVAFAQEVAPSYGGDPSNTVTYGFSAGTGPALAVAAAPSGGSIPGCATDAGPGAIGGVVLGDGEYFWQSAAFDGAFEQDLEEMRDAVALLIDPHDWTLDREAELFIWFAADGTAPRELVDDADGSDWLDARDPDGSIRSDLYRMGQLEDGTISYADSARLLDERARSAGFASTLVEFPGGHTTLDKVPPLVDALVAATSP